MFGDTMVPNIESEYILLLGYSIFYKKYNLTRINHQKSATETGEGLTGLADAKLLCHASWHHTETCGAMSHRLM